MSEGAYWCLKVPTGISVYLLMPSGVLGCVVLSVGAYCSLRVPIGV